MDNQRMLINALFPEEVRIAIIQEQQLLELEIESKIGRKLKGNIYKGVISRVEPSLQAAFVDIGTDRNAFLQINDVHPSLYRRAGRGDRRPNIQEILRAGQEIVVQVVKEERDLKGATLTTYVSLPGRYLVITPGTDRGGVSRKINDGQQRQRLKALSQELEVPSGIGIIIRTAGLDRSQADLARDLGNLLKVWEGVVSRAQTTSGPAPLYEEGDLATRVIRDYFTPEIREIIIDDTATFERVKDFVAQVMPRYRSRVKQFTGPRPIFSVFNIEDQIVDTLSPDVKLKSGGQIVIESLEALVAIDVNSGKATGGGTIEETAYRTNLEAAEEIARQLRLRDLGGLVVIDFIDMIDRRHKTNVEKRLEEALAGDKARVEIGTISKFGLLELSRQRLRASLHSQSSSKCPTCMGTGYIKTNELVALEALRKIQAAITVGHLSLVKVRLSPGPAMYLLNNKKGDLAKLENEYKAGIFVLADGRLRPDEMQFEMESWQDDQKPAKNQVEQAAPEDESDDELDQIREHEQECDCDGDESDDATCSAEGTNNTLDEAPENSAASEFVEEAAGAENDAASESTEPESK